MRLMLICAMLLGLAGCATLTEDECRVGDWYGIGFDDGRDGRKAGFLTEHRKACAEAGISPVQTEWEAGRQEGLKRYCRPARAYRIGRAGRKLSAVCTDDQWRQMKPAYQHGRSYYRIEQDLDELDREKDLIRHQLAGLLPEEKRLRVRLQSDLRYLRLREQQLELRQIRYSSWP